LMFVLVISTFLVTLLGVFAIYLLLERKRESIPERIRRIATVDKEAGSGSSVAGRARTRVADVLNRFKRSPPPGEELVERISGKPLTGARLLMNQAGYLSSTAHQVFQITRGILPILLAISAFLYGKSVGLSNRHLILLLVVIGFAGFLLPATYLRMKIRKRQEEITDSLPDGLDLLVVCVEAGLGLNAAFQKITEEFRISSPALSDEFDIVNREMVAGKPRQEALRAMGERTGVEDVKSLVAMLIQTEKLGTSVSRSLRVHSDSLRTKRRQRAEEAAAKTTIKLVFPLVFLLFPSLFIVILGPGVIQIVRVLFAITAKGG